MAKFKGYWIGKKIPRKIKRKISNSMKRVVREQRNRNSRWEKKRLKATRSKAARLKRSIASKKAWGEGIFTDEIRAQWHTPSIERKRSESMKLAIKKLRTPKSKWERSRLKATGSKKARIKRGIFAKKMWQNPEFRIRHAAMMKKVFNRKGYREKMSELRLGVSNPNYRGGKSREPYPLEWRETLKESVRNRDNYRCQICGIAQERSGRLLCVHHIDRNKKNLNPLNLISLCTAHHTKIQNIQDDLRDYFYAINLGLLPRK